METLINRDDFWLTVALLATATYATRLSFIVFLERRTLPTGIMRLLRYVPVTVLPALVAPMVFHPTAANGETDPARLITAAAVLIAGAALRSLTAAVIAGIGTLWTAQALIG